MKFFLFSLIVFLPNPLFAATVNLAVPFTAQAPEGNWNQPWQDACEETSITMIDNYYRNYRPTTLDVATAKEEILRAYNTKTKFFGYSLDENADQMSEWINHYYGWEAQVVERPTIASMKAELDAGRPIILPAHGTELNNPYFLSPLLDYHVIVLKGYDDEAETFIAHDPGTRRGLDIRYSFDTIEAAMHDFEAGNMPRARKVALFTRPDITMRSAFSDGDEDGLQKVQELLYQTNLHHRDTDRDGFEDGIEILAGYDPLVANGMPLRDVIVKPISRPEVYRLFKGHKAHIPTPKAFLDAGYRWQDIRLVRDDLFAYIANIPF